MDALNAAASMGWTVVSWTASLVVTSLYAQKALTVALGRDFNTFLQDKVDDRNKPIKARVKVRDEVLVKRLDDIAANVLHINLKVSFDVYRNNMEGASARIHDILLGTCVTGSKKIPWSRPRIVTYIPTLFQYAKGLYQISSGIPVLKETLALSTIAFCSLSPASYTWKAAAAVVYFVGTHLLNQKLETDAENFALQQATPVEIAEHIRQLTNVIFYTLYQASREKYKNIFSEKANKFILYRMVGSEQALKNSVQVLLAAYNKKAQDKTISIGAGKSYFDVHKNNEMARRIEEEVKKHPAHTSVIGYNGIYMDPDAEEYNFFFTFPGKLDHPDLLTVSKQKIQEFLRQDMPERRMAILIGLINEALNGPRYLTFEADNPKFAEVLAESANRKVDQLKKLSLTQLNHMFLNMHQPKITAPEIDEEKILYMLPIDTSEKNGFFEFLVM